MKLLMKNVIGIIGLLIPAVLCAKDIYRGVDMGEATDPVLTPNQFIYNGAPAGMSTFDTQDGAPVEKPCLYKYTVTNLPNDPPLPGDSGGVSTLPVGYTAVFDNNPAGHWSIRSPAGVSNANAAKTTSESAMHHRLNVINGTKICG